MYRTISIEGPSGVLLGALEDVDEVLNALPGRLVNASVVPVTVLSPNPFDPRSPLQVQGWGGVAIVEASEDELAAWDARQAQLGHAPAEPALIVPGRARR